MNKVEKIAKLNDLSRKDMGIRCKLVLTEGIQRLSYEDQLDIMEEVELYNDFTPDNDPYGERDFGNFEHNGKKIYWKIDYYAPDMMYGSADPSSPHMTRRVLTIMLASEY